MKIQVLESECPRCGNLAARAEVALRELGMNVPIEKENAIEEFMAYQVFATPALVIDSSVKAAGRIPSPAEIAAWVTAAAKQNTAA